MSRAHTVAFYTTWSNFVGQHKTLHAASAMAAGTSDQLLGMEDVVARIDAWDEPAKKRGSYMKRASSVAGAMNRVAVIGNAGGGKSGLARAVSQVRGVPYFAVDEIQWRPGWTAVPESDVSAALAELAEQPSWVIDGWGPWPSIEYRFQVADTIILVDHPVWIHFWWAAERQISCARGMDRPDGPPGCDMLQVTAMLFKMIWDIDQGSMPRLRSLLDALADKRDVHRITSPEQLNAFLASLAQRN